MAGKECPTDGGVIVSTYLRPRDVAERLDVRVHSVLTWIRSGELPASDVSTTRGGRPSWRIAESDLQTFLESRSQTHPTKQQHRRRKSGVVKEYV